MKEVVCMIFVVTIFLTSGCTIFGDDTDETDEEVLTLWARDEAEEEFLTDVIGDYEADNDINVDVLTVEGNNLEELTNLKEDGADVIAIANDDIGVGSESNMLTIINQDELSQQFVDNSVSALRYQDELYGIETLALYYSGYHFDEVPENLEEMADTVKDLNADSDDNLYFNIPGFIWGEEEYVLGSNLYYSYPFIGSFGGYIFGEDVSDIGLNKADDEGIELLKEIYEQYDYDKENAYIATIDGPWELDNLVNDGVYEVAPIPEFENEEYPETFVGVRSYSINSHSNKKSEALDLIKWLSSEEIAQQKHEELNIIPANEEIEITNENLKPFLTQIERSETPLPNEPEMNEVWEPMEYAFYYILVDDYDIQDTLDVAVDEIEDQLN